MAKAKRLISTVPTIAMQFKQTWAKYLGCPPSEVKVFGADYLTTKFYGPLPDNISDDDFPPYAVGGFQDRKGQNHFTPRVKVNRPDKEQPPVLN